jgi:hypothetical protein
MTEKINLHGAASEYQMDQVSIIFIGSVIKVSRVFPKIRANRTLRKPVSYEDVLFTQKFGLVAIN